MRLKPEIKAYIKSASNKLFPGSDVYLFGSRLNDELKGGDIDIMLLSDSKIDSRIIRKFRIDFIKRFGWQKLDLVNFTKNENSTFKQLILQDAEIL